MNPERLLAAASVTLTNIMDAGEYGPKDVDPSDIEKFYKDAEGDLWYPDVWELNEAVNEMEQHNRLLDA